MAPWSHVSSAFRIALFFFLIEVGTSRNDPLIHSQLSVMTSINGIASSGGSSWPSDPSNPSCHCCTKECNFQQGNLTCHRVLTFSLHHLSLCSKFIMNINIVQGQFRTINESGLVGAKFPVLERLSIWNSSLQELDSLLAPDELIEVNIYNNTNLSYVDWLIFRNAKKLRMLNLANNQLEYILGPIMNTTSPKLHSLDLSGNKWDCTNDFQWILKLHERGALLNGDKTFCQPSTLQKESWIDLSYSVITQEVTRTIVERECKNRTAACSCVFASKGKKGESYNVQVDCANRQLTSLPNELPNFTNELDVSGNYLTSLDQVIKYQHLPLKILIADSNKIQSIRNLSNSVFINNYNRFSLRHNNISPNEIPLNDIVSTQSSFEVKYLYLYNNSWECDCNMATTVRDWLWKNRHVVNDSSLILCSRDGKKVPVLQLLPSAVCESNRVYLDDGTSVSDIVMNERKITILHSIIYLEVAAIAVLGLKLAYDSWHYFRYGQIPWIATKLF